MQNIMYMRASWSHLFCVHTHGSNPPPPLYSAGRILKKNPPPGCVRTIWMPPYNLYISELNQIIWRQDCVQVKNQIVSKACSAESRSFLGVTCALHAIPNIFLAAYLPSTAWEKRENMGCCSSWMAYFDDTITSPWVLHLSAVVVNLLSSLLIILRSHIDVHNLWWRLQP